MPRTAASLIAQHKAAIAPLVARLQTVIATVPASGSYAQAGDLEAIELRLRELLAPFAAQVPLLVQDQMTIWFPILADRQAAHQRAALRAKGAIRLGLLQSDRGFGLQIEPADDAAEAAFDDATEEAVELLSDLAAEFGAAVRECGE